MPNKRIGIYAGTFDPVHDGHIELAHKARAAARLDQVYFLPEQQPRHKHGSTTFEHRMQMIQLAVQGHDKLTVLELPEDHFTVRETLPALQGRFPDAVLVLIMGADVAAYLATWPNVHDLFKTCELVIGLRGDIRAGTITDAVRTWPLAPQAVTIIEAADQRHVSSTVIRQVVTGNTVPPGLPQPVYTYCKKHHLYGA